MDFALNHIAVPRRDVAGLAALARDLGMTGVEIRNDLAGVAIEDGTPAPAIRGAVAGTPVLSINALQRFNDWNDARAAAAEELATYAEQAGAKALVLCPVNSRDDARSETRRRTDLEAALRALAPILRARGILGFVEPLGFAESSLRLKRTAIDAIDAVGESDTFRVLHDTFHHFLAEEPELFPLRTGLVHISGVEDTTLAREQIRDAHRVLVGPRDLMDNLGQIAALLDGGYGGALSFEPFSADIQAVSDLAPALRASMEFITNPGSA